MELKINDLVTRKSYGNDVLFKITDINGTIASLKGVNIRLIADADINDLSRSNGDDIEGEKSFLDRINVYADLDRKDYFYLPGKILHIDSDEDYLNRCLEYYKKMGIWAMGIKEE